MGAPGGVGVEDDGLDAMVSTGDARPGVCWVLLILDVELFWCSYRASERHPCVGPASVPQA